MVELLCETIESSLSYDDECKRESLTEFSAHSFLQNVNKILEKIKISLPKDYYFVVEFFQAIFEDPTVHCPCFRRSIAGRLFFVAHPFFFELTVLELLLVFYLLVDRRLFVVEFLLDILAY